MNNLTWYTWYSQAGYSDDNADDDVSDEKKTGKTYLNDNGNDDKVCIIIENEGT